jgi:hypothetical protein
VAQSGYNAGMGEERKKTSAGFWCTITIMALLILYPLSFGPASWLAFHDMRTCHFVEIAYRPILWLGTHNQIIRSVATWYMALGVPNGSRPSFNEHCIGW